MGRGGSLSASVPLWGEWGNILRREEHIWKGGGEGGEQEEEEGECLPGREGEAQWEEACPPMEEEGITGGCLLPLWEEHLAIIIVAEIYGR